MDIILYNPLSRNGRDPRYVERIKARLEKEGHDVRVQDLLTIESVETFIKTCAPDDRIVILGGDGTLSRVADAIHGHAFTQDILVARAGTGNDFVRSLKTKETFVKVNTSLVRLPLMATDGLERRVINGAGIGLDGFVGHLVNTSTKKKNKFNYFRHTLEGFVKFKPVKAQITIDGTTFREEKIWLVAVMHGAYFGGGMKIAPKASRKEDEIHVIVIKDIPKWLLTFIFPSIYMGRHTIFRRYVNTYVGKHVTVVTDDPTYAQIDGDTVYPVTTLSADIHEQDK
jgi:diacylglycerol kinase (ATP)